MSNALILTSPGAMTAPLPGTPVMRLSGDRIILTSDGFSGSGNLNGRLTDAALGGEQLDWGSVNTAAAASVSGGYARLNPASAATFFYFHTMPQATRAAEIGLTMRETFAPGLYVDLFRDVTSAPESSKLRMTLRPSTASSVMFASPEGNTEITGATFNAVPGDNVRMSYNIKTRALRVLVNDVVKVSLTYTPPKTITGLLAGIAGSAGATGSLDNFTLTEIVT